jgi:hypothetical protein
MFFSKNKKLYSFSRKKITTMQNLVARKTDDGTSVYNSPPTPQAALWYMWLMWLKFAI